MASIEISVPIGVSLRELSSITEALAKLYREVGRGLSDTDAAELRVSGHRKGSLVLECDTTLTEDSDPQVAERAVEDMISGLEALANGTKPPGFSKNALHHAASLVGPFTTENAAVVVAGAGRTVRCSPAVQATARPTTNPQTVRWESLEGNIKMTSVRNKPHFNIYELLSDQRIECRFSLDMLQQVREALGCRVLVSGEAHRRDDEIEYLNVARFERRPEASELPTFENIRGIFQTYAD